jgi:hypothetical protein
MSSERLAQLLAIREAETFKTGSDSRNVEELLFASPMACIHSLPLATLQQLPDVLVEH